MRQHPSCDGFFPLPRRLLIAPRPDRLPSPPSHRVPPLPVPPEIPLLPLSYGMPLGHVKAEMRGKTPLDGKQSNNYFRLHTDRCDMISLLSVRTASQGGHGRVASAVAIHDAMVERAPDLVPLLYNPIERIWEGGEGVIALPIWAFEETTGKFTTQISPSYIENAQYVNGVRKLTADEIEAIDLIEEIGLEIGHNFLQEPGQLTFMNNHLVYHGRTAWKFDEADDATSRDDVNNGRLLLRARGSRRTTRARSPTLPSSTRCGATCARACRAAASSRLSRRASRRSRPSSSRRTRRVRPITTACTSNWAADEDVTFGATVKGPA